MADGKRGREASPKTLALREVVKDLTKTDFEGKTVAKLAEEMKGIFGGVTYKDEDGKTKKIIPTKDKDEGSIIATIAWKKEKLGLVNKRGPRAESATSSGESGTTLQSFIATLQEVTAWGEGYENWKTAREAVVSTFALAKKVGGESELMAILTYLEGQE